MKNVMCMLLPPPSDRMAYLMVHLNDWFLVKGNVMICFQVDVGQ